jgi:hypothetical protein
MERVTIDQLLTNISEQLHLSKETEHEVLEEIRTHLEEVVTEAVSRGEDDQVALLNAAERFGIDEAGAELQAAHANWESIDAIAATALPVLFAIILRWLAFAPDGSVLDWQQLLNRPGFYTLAIAALVIPLTHFHRWRFALVGWGVFWLLSVIFVIFPSINHW